VLDRLESDDRAADAFAKLNIDALTAAKILLACIEADELARTFPDRIDLEHCMLGKNGKKGRLDKLEKAVADLRGFLGEINAKPGDRLSASMHYSAQDMAAVSHGLNLLGDAIALRRRTAFETLARMGVTRKSRHKAGETAAIGWIAEAVQRWCKRPHIIAAALLAEVTLGCEVTTDRLREAGRTRRREWHQP